MNRFIYTDKNRNTAGHFRRKITTSVLGFCFNFSVLMPFWLPTFDQCKSEQSYQNAAMQNVLHKKWKLTGIMKKDKKHFERNS